MSHVVFQGACFLMSAMDSQGPGPGPGPGHTWAHTVVRGMGHVTNCRQGIGGWGHALSLKLGMGNDAGR